MKVAVLNVNSELLLGKNSLNTIQFLNKKFLELGVKVSKILTLNNSPQAVLQELQTLSENFIVILGEDSSVKNFNIKKAIATFYGCGIAENLECVNAVQTYYKQANLPMLAEHENEFFLPQGAMPIISNISPLIPYYFAGEKHIVFLPNKPKLAEFVFNNHITKAVKHLYKISYKTVTIKTFGIAEKDVNILLSEVIKNKFKILVETYSENQEVAILIRFNETIDQANVNALISKIYEKLNKFIYADENINLVTRAVDLLSVTKNTLAIAENCTAGRITKAICDCNDGAEFVNLGMVLTNQEAKTKNLKISPEIIKTYGMCSVEVAYEMATNLIELTSADVAVCTTELKSIGQNAYQTFIAVGDIDGIHVYKCSFSGEKKDVLNSITQTTIFYLIKKLKQKDLFFNQTII